jgi:hypothetical protein
MTVPLLDRRAAAERVPLAEFVERSACRTLVIGPSKDPNAKVTLLLVPSHAHRPALAIKAPTTDGAAAAVAAEQRLLDALHAMPLGPLARTLPRVLDQVDFGGRPAAVMTALAGVPMSTRYLRWRHTARPERVAADFAAVASWLAGFQASTAQRTAGLDMDCGVTSALRRRFGEDAGLPRDLECLSRIHARLAREAVPRTAVHGDLWMGNVLMAGRDVSGVVDWEAGTTAGEPVRDVVRFAHMYALYLDRSTRAGRRVAGHPSLRAGAFGAGLEYALSGTGWFADLFRRFIRSALERLGAAPVIWREVVLAGIAEVAALTDDAAFARPHLQLFRRLTQVPPALGDANGSNTGPGFKRAGTPTMRSRTTGTEER